MLPPTPEISGLSFKSGVTPQEEKLLIVLSIWKSCVSALQTLNTALPDSAWVFVHYTGINKEGFRGLEEGQNVEFEVSEGKKGEQAVNVSVIG